MSNHIAQPADCPLSDILDCQPRFWPVAAEMLDRACRTGDPQAFLAQTLPLILAESDGDYGVVAVPQEGRWSIVAEAGSSRALPLELLAAALDGESARAAGDWAAVPLGGRERSDVVKKLGQAPHDKRPSTDSPHFGSEPVPFFHNVSAEVLAAHCRTADAAKKILPALQALSPVLRSALCAVRAREKDRRRLRRLEAILEIANSWNQTREVQSLLLTPSGVQVIPRIVPASPTTTIPSKDFSLSE